MYEAFFGFREKPFNLTPDPRFLYLSPKHNEAFAHLEFGLQQRGGFVVITGEVGTGKTTLCRYFLENLDEKTSSAFVLYPSLSALELLRSICEDLGIRFQGSTTKKWVDGLHRYLLESRAADRNTVVVIDEAQNLSAEVLEQIRLISNLETSTEKLIQIVLIGQSELNVMLSQENLRQLAQRATARYHLKALSQKETNNYIRHRLRVAGGSGKVSFTPGAIRAIYHHSKGIPRLINLTCDRVLLAGFVMNRREVDTALVKRAIRELEQMQGQDRRWYRSWRVTGALAAVVLAALGLSAWWAVLGLAPRPAPEVVETTGPAESIPRAPSPTEEPPEPTPTSPTADTINGQDIELRLQTLSSGLSRRGAAGTILALWGIELSGGAGALSPEEDLSQVASRFGLEATRLTAHFDQLRRLNLPAILELFHTSRSDACYAALIRLDEDWAVISFVPGEQVRTPVAELGRFWVRQAFVFWKDFEGLGDAPFDDPRMNAWLREGLENLGFLSGQDEPSEEALRAALKRFQSSAFLVSDGIAGPKTQMALYSLSGQYPIPRLIEP